MIVSSAECVPEILRDAADELAAIVSLVEPGGSIPQVASWLSPQLQHFVIECVDVAMAESERVVRFGGDRNDMFQE